MSSRGLGSVVSVSPGRVRLRVFRPHRTAKVFAEIRSLLAGLPGVTAVEVNATTGSVLVTYDPSSLDVAHLLRLGSELGWLSGDTQTGGATGDGLSLTDWRRHVDLGRAAEGVAVLGVAGLGALAGPAVGLSARVGSLSAAAAFVLLRRWSRRLRAAQ